MPAAITEKRVVEIWQESLQGHDLKTITNEPIKVIYPGRRNDDRGADFKDAIIATGQGQLKGDIEIHVKTSHWWTHQHHRDPTYNRVILHVVYQNDTVKELVLENGFKVPTLALCGYIGQSEGALAPPLLPCRSNTRQITKVLDEAGEARLLARSTLFREMITKDGAGQALYEGVMTALGYSKNKAPMAELARRLPLQTLETLTVNNTPDNEYLARCQAYLAGAAGLLPSQRERLPVNEPAGSWAEKLENIWANGGEAACLSLSDWHFFKVRPGNHPLRRLAAVSHLLLRYREKGLLVWLEERFMEDNAFHSLEEGLMVAADGYWGCYMEFGVPAAGAAPALLGKERAGDIIINVLLPFAYARGPAAQGKRALDIYRQCRAPAENTLVKHMRQQLKLSRSFISNARQQQGLIHIYQTFCLEGGCGQCPLRKP
jgi:hypothetical protein